MILIDTKGDKPDNHPGADIISHIGGKLRVKSERADLIYGDAAFDGRGPLGTICVGIERKALHDMLNCIDDARYNAQRIGMKQMYDISVLMVEGHWKPHDPEGVLMEGFNGGISWGYCRQRSARVMYHKLYRYLISVAMSGVLVTYSRDVFHTAFNIVEWYHYFQKPWDEHKALQEMQKFAIPTLALQPSLTRLWAFALDGIGSKLSGEAEKVFKTPYDLATADEAEWLKVPGVGTRTAQSIVWEVMTGRKR